MSREKKLVPKMRFKEFEDSQPWQSKDLGDMVNFYSGLTYSPSNIVAEPGTLVIRSSNVKNSEIVSADNVYVDSTIANSENVQIGDIIVVVRNGSRHLIGKNAQVKTPMENTVIGAFMTGIRSNISKFINALLDTNKFQIEIYKDLGATINQITTGNLRKMKFNFPNEDEANKIGIYFEEIDNLIISQRKKINKVKNIKSAYLSEMFPKEGEKYPKKRFEGFIEPWEEYKMKDMGRSLTGLSGKSKKDFGHGEAEFVTYMNVFNNPIAKSTQTAQVEIDENQTEVEYGDIFFTVSSETPNEVGMSSVWLYDRPNVYLNSFCFGFRPNIKLNPYYMAYMLRSPEIRKRFILLAQGISRYNISKSKAMELLFPIPSNEEQEKIGQFFKNLDHQISIEEDKLAKLEKLKQAYLNDMFV